MERIVFGKTGLMVSKAAFGGIPIMRLSKDKAAQIVKEAIDLGINFIDTAHVYTDSEEKIGQAIKGMKREDLVIASKSPAGDKKAFNEHLELSLKRLGTDYIDIYQLHNIATEERWNEVTAPGGSMEGLEEAVKAGKVRYAGFSSHSVPVSIRVMKTQRFASVQLPFNFIDCEAAAEAVPLARELGIGFIAMKPMGGGLLDDAGLNLRYLFSFEGIFPDPGIEKSEEIREIVSIIEKNEPLSEKDKKEIEKIKTEFGPSWCHRCDYCKPCPQDISISLALNLKSSLKRMPAERARSMCGPSIEKARTCLECGECVKKCPYNLNIPALLKEQIKYWDSLVS